MDIDSLNFFNPFGELKQWRNSLPHWQQNSAIYFVTFRLADSIPATILREWEFERSLWMKLHPQPWSSALEIEFHSRFSTKYDSHLDAGHGCCLLRRRDIANIIAEGLTHFDGERYSLISWVVMPNHVHALFILRESIPLGTLLQSWKSWTARRINAMTNRNSALWQKDYFDRLVRDHDHFFNCLRYIRANPQKAHLQNDDFLYWQSTLCTDLESTHSPQA